MKSILLYITLITTLVLCGLGCQSIQTTSSKLLVSTAVTVNEAMQVWIKYASTHGITEEQDQRARAAYSQYQVIMKQALEIHASLMKASDKNDPTLSVAWIDVSKQLATSMSFLLSSISVK